MRISCCSGSVIWGAMWAAGLSAQAMADFSLSWQPEDYLDIQWTRFPHFLLSALRDFTGLAKGRSDRKLLRGISFYDLFIDRRRWPELIRQGCRATRRALERFANSGHRRQRAPAV